MPYKDVEKQKLAQQSWYQANRAKYRHADRMAKEVKREWLERLKAHPCTDCQKSFPSCVMEFHHRDPATKAFCLGKGLYNYGYAKLEAEIAKCDLLCANCHRIREHVRDKVLVAAP